MSNPGLSYRPPRRLSDVPELLRLSLKLTISPVRGLGLHTGERNNLKNNAKGGFSLFPGSPSGSCTKPRARRLSLLTVHALPSPCFVLRHGELTVRCLLTGAHPPRRMRINLISSLSLPTISPASPPSRHGVHPSLELQARRESRASPAVCITDIRNTCDHGRSNFMQARE